MRITSPASAHPLRVELDNQEETFAKAFQILHAGVAQRAFPSASVAITQSGSLISLKGLGQFTYETDSPAVTIETVFDLASVSKVLAATTMASILYERGILDLDAPLAGVVPEFLAGDMRRNAVTFRMLLAHSSGLPAYEKLFLRAKNRDELLRDALAVPLHHEPGTHAEYSDIGFILLGVALERVADETLDRFCQREVFGPLGMLHITFNPPAIWKSNTAPTADDRTFRQRVIQGEVQDENASALGGVAGHA